MKIRRMTEEDLPQVCRIERECFSLPWSRQAFLDGLSQSAIFLVAEPEPSDGFAAEDRIAGYIGMYVSFEEGEITNVAVAEECRNRGIAKALVRRMQREAFECGVVRMILEVRMSNCPAIAVYADCGFKEIGVRKGFYEQPREDARIMEFRGMPV